MENLQYPRKTTDSFRNWRMTGSCIESGVVKGICQCETYRLAKEDLENKYLDFREKLQREYELKLETEIEKLKRNTTGELEKLMRATNQSLQREITSLRESKLYAERSRDEALAKVRDLNIQNQEVTLQMKQLELMDSSRLAGVESELKLKTFELGRCSLLYSESEAKYRSLQIEKEKLSEKLDVVKEELSKVHCESEQNICSLQLQIRDKAVRLEAYEKLEDELDRVVIQAASFPDSKDADEVLAAYGYGANIPCNAKRRLQQSLSLARRVMELEQRSQELKESLFKERDQRRSLQQQLDAANSTMIFAGYPTTELLELVAKKRVELMKTCDALKNSRNEVAYLKLTEEQLRKNTAEAEKREQQTMRHLLAVTDLKRSTARSLAKSRGKLGRVQLKESHETKVLHANIKMSSASSSTTSICPNNAGGIHLKKPLTFSKVQCSAYFE